MGIGEWVGACREPVAASMGVVGGWEFWRCSEGLGGRDGQVLSAGCSVISENNTKCMSKKSRNVILSVTTKLCGAPISRKRPVKSFKSQKCAFQFTLYNFREILWHDYMVPVVILLVALDFNHEPISSFV